MVNARMKTVLLLAVAIAAAVGTSGTAHASDVVVADHRVSLAGDRVEIHTRWRGWLDEPVPLVWPLPRDAAVVGAEVQRDGDGRPISIDAEGSTEFIVSVPLETLDDEGRVPLAVPQGDADHRVAVERELSFRPDPSLRIGPRGRRSVAPDVRDPEVIDAHLGQLPGRPLLVHYVSTTDLTAAGGYVGTLEPARTVRHRQMVWAGGAFVLVILAFLAAHRRLRRSADIEHAEALLDREFAGLE
jgi:hypothetical protein